MAIKKISQINQLTDPEVYTFGKSGKSGSSEGAEYEIPGYGTQTFVSNKSCLDYILFPDPSLTPQQKEKVERLAASLFELSFPRKKLHTTDSYDESNYYDSFSINLSALQEMLGVSEAYEWAKKAYNNFYQFIINPILDGPTLSGEVWIGRKIEASGQCAYDSTGYNGEFPYVAGNGNNPHNIWMDPLTHLHVSGKTDLYNTVVIHSSQNKNNRIFEVDGKSFFHGIMYARAIQACWADLAEIYEADSNYEPGTLVKFGGEKEITVASGNANAVVTKNPGLILNQSEAEIPEKHMVGIALTGRTPVKVIGPVKKFDKIVISATPGVGIACNNPEKTPGLLLNNTVIGRALEDSDDTGIKLVECVVQMNMN